MNDLNRAKSMTLLSVIIGYSLIGNLNSAEQNALGNFFMEIGQILETNSAILQSFGSSNNVINNENELILNALKIMEEKIKKP